MTCDSVGSADAVQNNTMSESNENHSHVSENHSDSKTDAATPGSEEQKTPDERDGKDVNIDFSHINDVGSQGNSINSKVSSPNKDYMMFSMSAPVRRLEHPADRSLMLSFLGSLFFLIASLVVFCPTLVLVAILFPAGWILKHSMACCCCCTPNRTCACCCSKMLSHSDAIWLHDSPLNQMISQSLVTLEHGIDVVRIRDLIHARLISAESKSGVKIYPRFTQKIVPLYSGYAWVDDEDFTICNHVYTMPSTIQTKEDLQNFIADISTKPLPQDRPLWEMHILSNFGADKDTMVLFRIHPCVTDGISLVQILFSSVVDSQVMSCQLKPRFGRGAFVFNALRAFMIGPLIFLHKWLFMRRDYNLLHGPKLSGKKVIAWSEPFSLALATRVKQVTRSTLNDILLSVAAGNIRTYFQSRGVQNPYDVLATIPVDLRSDSSNIKMGSKFEYVDLTLPTNTEGTIPRLWEVKHEMDEVKNSANPVVMMGSQWLMTNMFPECLYKRMWWSLWNKSSCVVSNLPGPETTLTFASRELKSIVYWLPPPPEVALSISFMTYADQVRMAVIGDAAVVPNPHVLTTDFIFQLDKLAELLAHRRIPGEHHGRRIDAAYHDDHSHKEPTVEELQQKMAEVQQQLQDLKSRLDTDNQQQYSEEERALVDKVEQLKEEFRELLAELRRKRAAQGSSILSDDEDEDDGELRRSSYRRRSHSGASRRSVVSGMSTARPLTTSPPPSSVSHTSPPSSRPHSPPSPSHMIQFP